ncbi:MAG: hypothetical protein HFI32_11020 [Lachnospiraceae bacterium]|jgi:FKBP-type peptidyl-prolyl cis-trans isomerase (trigger factor)|nr:hypothetical protein [Lachnospiraceae bacterium]
MKEERVNTGAPGFRQYIDACQVELSQEQVEQEISAILCEIQCRRRYEMLERGCLPENPYFFFAEGEAGEEQGRQDQMREIREEAERAVKTRLVIQRVIEEQRIQVTPEELEAEARALAERKQIPFEMVRDFLGADFALLAGDLKERKAAAYICGMA